MYCVTLDELIVSKITIFGNTICMQDHEKEFHANILMIFHIYEKMIHVILKILFYRHLRMTKCSFVKIYIVHVFKAFVHYTDSDSAP